jgi:hypothetical protein
METREAAQRWADVWQRGWEEHDADAIAEDLAGMSLLRFDPSGLVVEHRDFWNRR